MFLIQRVLCKRKKHADREAHTRSDYDIFLGSVRIQYLTRKNWISLGFIKRLAKRELVYA